MINGQISREKLEPSVDVYGRLCMINGQISREKLEKTLIIEPPRGKTNNVVSEQV